MTHSESRLIDLLDKAAREMLERGNISYLGEYDTCEGLGKFIEMVREEIRAVV